MVEGYAAQMREALAQGLVPLGLTLTDAQMEALCRYGQLLAEKNAVMNLTAITEPQEVARLHFVDCLALLRTVDFCEKAVIDVGCGAGFPGVPLKIGAPSIRLTLLDSTAKRMDWLRQALLPAIGVEAECLTGRAEELISGRRAQYDVAVSRAVARLNVLSELCLPYVRVGGYFLAMKGAMANDEALEAKNAIRTMGGRLAEIAEYPVGDAIHRVVVIEKVHPTPPAYPRRFSKIKQQPL